MDRHKRGLKIKSFEIASRIKKGEKPIDLTDHYWKIETDRAYTLYEICVRSVKVCNKPIFKKDNNKFSAKNSNRFMRQRFLLLFLHQ